MRVVRVFAQTRFLFEMQVALSAAVGVEHFDLQLFATVHVSVDAGFFCAAYQQPDNVAVRKQEPHSALRICMDFSRCVHWILFHVRQTLKARRKFKQLTLS